jgi:hypothetical protein
MLTLLFILNAAVAPAQQPPDLATEVGVSIQPSSMSPYQLLKRKTPDTYTCRADVLQAEGHVINLSAEMAVATGSTQQTTRRNGEYELEFSVTLKNNRAESVVAVKRGEKLLTRQRSTVYINTRDPVIAPAN